jgi:hypothetical protein
VILVWPSGNGYNRHLLVSSNRIPMWQAAGLNVTRQMIERTQARQLETKSDVVDRPKFTPATFSAVCSFHPLD